MIPILDSEQYVQRMLSAPRPGGGNILAFYDNRIGVIGTDFRLLLVPMDDHLVHRGDGVFETLKYVDGRLYQLDPHLERMRRSAAAIHLDLPCPQGELRTLVLEVARASGERDGLVRILVGRGLGGFGVDPFECPEPSLYLAAYRFHPKPEEVYARGAAACRTAIPAKPQAMSRIKTTNYLPNVLMKREAVLRGCDFPICFDEEEHIAEGAVENLCLVDRDGALVLPGFANALPGTTVTRATALIRDELPVVCRAVREGEIASARELIAIGTTIDAIAIVRYEGRTVGEGRPGPVALRLRELLRRDIRENGIPI